MRILLDTHTFLWYLIDDPRTSPEARRRILDPARTKVISPASYREIAIKVSIGKLALREPYEDLMHRGAEGSGFEVLPIVSKHTAILTTLPFHHRDPFDRLLIAQALAERLPILSCDSKLDQYGVERVW